MNKANHYCDNINCNHNDTKGLCCLFNTENCKYRQLQKENAELKSECRRCIYTDSPCILSDYGKDKNGICDHFKDVFDENAELDCQKNRNKYCYSCANATEKCFKNEIGCPCGKYKSYKDENTELRADNDARKFAMAMSEKVEKQLREENAELNEKLSEQKQYTAFKCNEFVKKKDVYEKEHFLLTKAKSYLKYFIEILKKLGVDKEPLVIEAEQFLSEVER